MSLRIYGNRQLKTLSGQDTRPTPSLVREALFNIWQGTIADCRWLDLCTGSGAMGAEALCRGAALAVGIERSPRGCAIIRENWQQVANPDQTFQILRGDVRQRIKTLEGQQFDRIYFDPPYASDLYKPVIEAIAHYQLLAPEGELAVEHRGDQLDLPIPSSLEICRQKAYGNIALTFYSRSQESGIRSQEKTGHSPMTNDK
ncbi:16S rRNA (guanine(966)-N(2))-methyltransferase RsmD [Kovacikia minuta CCNUW1]|uniref:16S rRNA (guanine(966)-N(2))-methyltransferase RsmD n=1 Tax=Kovacikia minuta TaxID=2931930 RepID=UPI001CCE4E03|nr:16S rRNA (guanine(966)-N(2))-methyltransferase RsmD [Kovacikia minuta]UBF23784.1 16S rRNA (guanine(966)-N(2))-methyltransferase RsmD [Kovacikia minuta CCNUW1]